jgi:hypothetical protein
MVRVVVDVDVDDDDDDDLPRTLRLRPLPTSFIQLLLIQSMHCQVTEAPDLWKSHNPQREFNIESATPSSDLCTGIAHTYIHNMCQFLKNGLILLYSNDGLNGGWREREFYRHYLYNATIS